MSGTGMRPLRLALVEHLSDVNPVADVVVALSPVALKQCLDRKIQATVLDDHVDRLPLFQDQVAYLRWQIGWIQRLDAAAGLDGAARAAALAFKGPVDTTVATGRSLRRLLEDLAPTHVAFFDRDRPETSDDVASGGEIYRWGADAEPSPTRRLIGPICCDLAIPLERIDFSTTSGPVPTESFRARLRRGLGRRLGPRRSLRPPRPTRAQGPATVMTWYGGYGARAFFRSQRCGGRRVLFLQRGGKVTRLVEPGFLRWRRHSGRIALERDPAWPLSTEVIDIIAEIDDWSGTPGTAAAVRPRLESVLRTMCPAVKRAAAALELAFQKADVDRLACANPCSVEEFAAIVAAGRTQARRMLVQHGDHLMSYESWVSYEVPNFEEWVCSDPTVADEVRTICEAVGIRAPVFAFASYRHREIKRSGIAGAQQLPTCYLPTFYTGGSIFFGGFFDDAWYFRWQLQLLAWMTATPNHNFIWKTFPSANHAEDPIPDLIGNIDNVLLETRPFTSILSSVGRTIVDLPSTPLFESVQAGIPTLALSFPRFLELRPAAKELFSTVLRECAAEAEALTEIEGFIQDDPARWVMDISPLSSEGAACRR